jgi:hypothetical protein
LGHDRDIDNRGAIIERLEQNRAGQMIGDISDEPHLVVMEIPERFQVDIQEIGMENRDVGGGEPGPQVFNDTPVDFDKDEMSHPARKMPRQRAPSGADFHDDVIRFRTESLDDVPDDVFIDKKVLAKGLAGF